MKISASGFKVYLETPKMDDADSIWRIGNDPEVLINVSPMPSPYGHEDAVQLVSFAQQRLLLGEDFHMCIRLEDKQLVGMCSIAKLDRLNKKVELGYWLGRTYWGNGYAREAIRLIMGFGFSSLEVNRIYATVLVGNDRSIKLLESLGYVREGIERDGIFHMGKFQDDLVFGILKKDYKDSISVLVEQ